MKIIIKLIEYNFIFPIFLILGFNYKNNLLLNVNNSIIINDNPNKAIIEYKENNLDPINNNWFKINKFNVILTILMNIKF